MWTVNSYLMLCFCLVPIYSKPSNNLNFTNLHNILISGALYYNLGFKVEYFFGINTYYIYNWKKEHICIQVVPNKTSQSHFFPFIIKNTKNKL